MGNDRVEFEDSILVQTPHVMLWGNERGMINIIQVAGGFPLEGDKLDEALTLLKGKMLERGWWPQFQPIQLNLPFDGEDVDREVVKRGLTIIDGGLK